MSINAGRYGLALASPILLAIAACSDNSPLSPERLAPTGPSKNVIATVAAAAQLCTRGPAGTSTYSISYTPGAGSSSVYNLPAGTSVSQSSGDCTTVFTATGTDVNDPPANVTITQLTTPAGSVFSYTLVTDFAANQAACTPAADPCGADVQGTSKTVTVRVNAYHGSVVTYFNTLVVTGCSFTQGYWKNHTNVWPGINPNSTFYGSGLSWINLFKTPPRGSAYIILAHQYMAAKLNVANGASMPQATKDVFDLATAFFAGGASGPLTTWAGILDRYNNGFSEGGPRHCE